MSVTIKCNSETKKKKKTLVSVIYIQNLLSGLKNNIKYFISRLVKIDFCT